LLATSEASIPVWILGFCGLIDSYAYATSSHERISPSYAVAEQYLDILVSLSDKVEIGTPAHELYV
jgi:hypothetical protein